MMNTMTNISIRNSQQNLPIYRISFTLFLFTLFTVSFMYSSSLSAAELCAEAYTSDISYRADKSLLTMKNIPKTHEEKKLAKQGWSKAFYSGVDAVNYITELGRYLRSQAIDPKETHIENFIPLIDAHIEYIRQGIKKHQKGKSRIKNLYLLRKFKKEAQLKIKRKQVTYDWWLIFNFRLAVLASKSSHKLLPKMVLESYEHFKHHANMFLTILFSYAPELAKEIERFISLVDSFPENIILPVLSPLGFIALNKATTGEYIIPIELSRKQKQADGLKWEPDQFFLHDSNHIIEGYGKPLLPSTPDFHTKLMSYVNNNLSLQAAKQVMTIYMILTHEIPKQDTPTKKEITDPEALFTKIHSNLELLIEDPTVILSTAGLMKPPSFTLAEAEKTAEGLNSSTGETLYFGAYQRKYEKALQESIDVFVRTAKHILEQQ